MQLLIEDNLIEWQGSWKNTYEKYLGVYKIERKNENIWDMIDNHEIISLFQFEADSGIRAINLCAPRNLEDLVTLNSMMRLMTQEGETESPLDRYARLKKDISQWYKEMDEAGLTKEEQKWIEPYMLPQYGNSSNQESFMIIVQDPKIGGHSLLFADKLRKAISKKQVKDFIEIQKEYYDTIEKKNLSYKLCDYVWKRVVLPQKGYAFNASHVNFYSIIALQEANLAYRYPMVYWNCANLISDSGGQDGTVNYGKIASAVNRMRKEGINIALPDINTSKFDFKPDSKNNQIIYGLKPMSGVGATQANLIVANQPYSSMWDFYNKIQTACKESEQNKFGDKAMIALIKSGCFDSVENKPREEIMKDYVTYMSEPLISLKTSDIETLNSLKLLTPSQKANELRYIRFKKYVFQKSNIYEQAGKSPTTFFYKLDKKYAEPYFTNNFADELTEGKDYKYPNNCLVVKRGSLEKVIEKRLENFKHTVLENKEIINKVNEARFNTIWNEKATGSISKWEMDSLSYYYHEHELANVNRQKYDIVNFDDMPEEPEVSGEYYYKGQKKMRFVLHRICGTVIDKDKNHETVTVLTPDGVVTVKLYKGQFTFYDKENVRINENGEKERIESSWFKKGNKLLIAGHRRGTNFIPRKYSDSLFKHTIQLIKDIDEDGNLTLQADRIGTDRKEEEVINYDKK